MVSYSKPVHSIYGIIIYRSFIDPRKDAHEKKII